MEDTPKDSINPDTIAEESVMKIMVASDIHLGYNEKDPVRGEDSFIAFEEVLQHALDQEVDFILLGGDLFHDANPSQNSMNKCMRLLKTYTLGDKPIMLEYLSDQSVNFFDSLTQTVNYEDPNMNIAIPVFSIHGNHDDPSGFGRLSSLDVLSTTGLINYFGKWTDLTNINISPVMMRKGDTQLALYGLSHIHDPRLTRLFHESKVRLEEPENEKDKWFNILVVHQNRADRGPKNFLPEEILPEFLDIVVWGHEHDCRMLEDEKNVRGFRVLQPGSTVATSLSQGESIDKHCAVISIYKRVFQKNPIKLKTVRPFVFDSINIDDYVDILFLNEGDAQTKVKNFITERIEAMIREAEAKLSGHERQPKLPLIRLRIQVTNEEYMFNAIRFGQQFNNKVANPMEMIKFQRSIRRIKNKDQGVDEKVFGHAFDEDLSVKESARVEEIVERYFEDTECNNKLEVISTKVLSEVCRRLVDHEDDDAAYHLIKFVKDAACCYLNDKLPKENELGEELLNLGIQSDDIFHSAIDMLDNMGKRPTSKLFGDDVTSDETSSKKAVSATATAKQPAAPRAPRGRGRGAATAARGKATSKAAATTKSKTELNVSSFRQETTQQPPQSRNRSKVCYINDSDSD